MDQIPKAITLPKSANESTALYMGVVNKDDLSLQIMLAWYQQCVPTTYEDFVKQVGTAAPADSPQYAEDKKTYEAGVQTVMQKIYAAHIAGNLMIVLHWELEGGPQERLLVTHQGKVAVLYAGDDRICQMMVPQSVKDCNHVIAVLNQLFGPNPILPETPDIMEDKV